MLYEDTLPLKRKFMSQTTDVESLELYKAVITSVDGDVVEVGSAWGGTTIVLIGAAENVNKTVISIDPYPEELEGKSKDYPFGLCKELKETFAKNILNGQYKNVIQFNENTADCIGKIQNALSVVFIDGCHDLANVQDEIRLLLPKLAIGGLLYVHDTAMNSGQISGKPEDGLVHIYEWIKEYPVKNITTVGSMLKCEKI